MVFFQVRQFHFEEKKKIIFWTALIVREKNLDELFRKYYANWC